MQRAVALLMGFPGHQVHCCGEQDTGKGRAFCLIQHDSTEVLKKRNVMLHDYIIEADIEFCLVYSAFRESRGKRRLTQGTIYIQR